MIKKGSVEGEERRFIVERTMDGIIVRIMDSEGRDVIDPILLSFHEAMKLGRLLLSYARAGITQTDLLVRRLAELEHEIRRLDNQVRELLKTVKKNTMKEK